MVKILSRENSILNTFIAELRDEYIQKDSMRFRKNLERIGEIMAYEISKKLYYGEQEIITPLGVSNMTTVKYQPVLATILRAGLPLHNGFLNFFDQAESTFISAYRKHHSNEDNFQIKIDYLSSSLIDDRIIILNDTMLATGASIVATYKALLKYGTPKHLHIACVISSSEGLEYVKKHLPENTSIWVVVVDEELTAQGYIVPGLGDAGDLSYGEKV
jgi:uracil phosphoribosyltransferase